MFNIILYYRFWQTFGNYLFIYLAAIGIWPFLIAFRLECRNGLNDSSPSLWSIVVFNNKCTLKIIKCIDCLCGACAYVPSLCDLKKNKKNQVLQLCTLCSLFIHFKKCFQHNPSHVSYHENPAQWRTHKTMTSYCLKINSTTAED